MPIVKNKNLAMAITQLCEHIGASGATYDPDKGMVTTTGPRVVTHEQLMAMPKEDRYQVLRDRVAGKVVMDDRIPPEQRKVSYD